jgi:GNAT superfamily N-acetyltransferase
VIFLDYFTLAERYEGMISDLMKLSEPQDWRGFNSSEKVSLHFFGGKVKVVLEFNSFDPYMNLDLIKTEKEARGQGYATKVMNLITKSANKFGVNMELDAIPQDNEGLSRADLIEFYKRFGFEFIGEYGMDFMRRKYKTQ